MPNIAELQKAILAMHGCESQYVASVQVHEAFREKMAWQGTVEVFEITGHPKAKRCYAWNYEEDGVTRSIAVLEIPPVDSPQTAVMVAISAKARDDDGDFRH